MERLGPGYGRGYCHRYGDPAGHAESFRRRAQTAGDIRGIFHGVLRQLLPGNVDIVATISSALAQLGLWGSFTA